MPRDVSATRGDGLPAEDGEGTGLAGPEQACAAVVAVAGAMLQEPGGRSWSVSERRLAVADAEGAEACTLPVAGSPPDGCGGGARSRAAPPPRAPSRHVRWHAGRAGRA